ncbi:MAG: peptide deformylase [Anaerolineales bacterium]|nr:peptide deformylase [Anaerolineales bacterium]
MALREIVTVPHPTLRRSARKVTDFGPDLQTLIDDMVETMRVAPGVGLAAPQIDVSLRVIVVEFGDEDDEEVPAKLYSVVNPEITRPAGAQVVGTEGCLSIPGLIGDVERAQSVVVRGQTRHGQPFKLKAKGWLARIFQHEVDHLNGILFTDKALQVWQLQAEDDAPAMAD